MNIITKIETKLANMAGEFWRHFIHQNGFLNEENYVALSVCHQRIRTFQFFAGELLNAYFQTDLRSE